MAARLNPSRGGKPDKLMRDALLIALKREITAADGRKTRRLSLIAEKLVELAADGDIGAIREVFDRIDGRAAAQLIQPSEGQQLVISWIGEEIDPSTGRSTFANDRPQPLLIRG
jgi:hypothetical protein